MAELTSEFYMAAANHSTSIAQSAPCRLQSWVYGRVTMTTQSSENGATTTSRMNFSGHIGHVTIFS